MSSISASGGLPAALRPDNITAPASMLRRGNVMIGIGGVVLVSSLGPLSKGFGGGSDVAAMATFHAAACGILAICFSGLIFQMIFNLLNAGWVATLRRVMENVIAFLPIAIVMAYLVPVLDYFQHGKLFSWMNPASYSDYLLAAKFVYFFGHPFGPADAAASAAGKSVFPLFFFLRAGLYLAVGTYFSRRLISLSAQADQSADRGLAAKARYTSAWLPIVALTTAFAAFDLLKSADYRFFSTMWGVYFFAGGAFGFFYLVAFLAARLRLAGKLEGAVTEEHFHDLGKLMFSFTVFWGYIAFSQYFLIWYSNIPEETSYFTFRKDGIWNTFSVILCFGHFLLPFLVLISRHIKKRVTLLIPIGLYGVAIHFIDMYWIVRPMAMSAQAESLVSPMARLLEFTILVGTFLLFLGFVIKRMSRGPLVAVNDPYMHEALHHKNYV